MRVQSRPSRPRLRVALTVGAALTMLITACGGSDAPAAPQPAPAPAAPAPAPAPEPEPAPGPPEKADITIATIPIMAMAPFFYAMEEGLFTAEGLNVTPAVGSGGAALIPRILAGEVDIFWTALEPLVVARSEGIALSLVAPGHYYESVNGDGIGVFALPGKGIDSVTDLAGKTVAINTLNTFGHIMIQAALQNAGVDLASVRFVEIPFPQMPPALERGEVDAMWVPEPFVTIARGNLGIVNVNDGRTTPPILADLPAFRNSAGGAWGSAEAFAQANPNTIAAFQRAIAKANAAIAADSQLGADVMQRNSESSAALLARATWPSWSDDFDLVANLRETIALMVEFGILAAPVDAEGIVVPARG